MRPTRLVLALSALTFACSSGDTRQFAQLPAGDGELQFLVHLRGGRLLQAWNPSDLAAGPVELIPEAGDVIAHLSISPAELSELDPLLAPELLDAVELAPKPPCAGCKRACISEDTLSISISIPTGTLVSELNDEGFAPATTSLVQTFTEQFRLELPRDVESCRPAIDRGLVPFGAKDEDLQPNIQSMRVVDRDRLFLSSPGPGALMLAIRGRDQSDNLRRVLRVSDLPHDVFGGFDVLAVTSTSVRLLVVSRNLASNPPSESSIHEAEVTEDGFRVLRTLLTVPGTVIALHVTPGGGFIAVGDEGLVVASRDGRSLVQYSLGLQYRLVSVRSYTDEVGTDFIGGGLGLVAEGDVFAGASGMTLGGLERAGGIVDSSVHGFRIRPTPDGPEVWAVTAGQGMFRRARADVWEAIDVEAPFGVRACTGIADECGRANLNEALEGVEFDAEGTLLYANEDCSTVFTRAASAICTSYFDVGGPPKLESPGITALSNSEAGTFVAKGARVYELTP